MPSPTVTLVIAAILLVLLAGLVLAAWLVWLNSDPQIRERVARAETIRVSSPQQSRKICAHAVKQLTQRLKSRSLSPAGVDGLTRAHLVLAELDRTEKKPDAAREHVLAVRQLLVGQEEQLERLLLTYYLAIPETSTDAFDLYLVAAGKQWLKAENPLLDQTIEALRRCCEVSLDLDAQELRTRVKRNRSASTQFPDLEWPIRSEARAWSLLKAPHRAIPLLEALLHIKPDSLLDRLTLVNELIAADDKPRARLQLEDLTQRAAAQHEILLEVARLYLRIEDSASGCDLLNRICVGAPHLTAQARLLFGLALLKRGVPARAIDHLRYALNKEPANIRTRLALSEALSQTGEHAEAADLLTPTGAEPLEPDHLYALACALFNAERWPDAARRFQECIEKGIKAATCSMWRLRCLTHTADRSLGPALERAEKLNPGHPHLAFYRGVQLYQAGNYQQALPNFVRAHNEATRTKTAQLLKRSKANVIACYMQMAGQHIARRQYLNAARAYEAVRKNTSAKHPTYPTLGPILAQCHFRHALERFRQGGPQATQEALETAKKALTWHASSPTRAFLAALTLRNKAHSEAAEYYSALQEAEPNEPAWRFGWALASLRNGATEEAVPALRAAAAQGGPYAIRSALALSAHDAARGDYNEAIKTLVTAVTPGNADKDAYRPEACRYAVLFALNSGDAIRARRLATSLFSGTRISPESVLGVLLVDGGDYAQALPYLEQSSSDPRLVPLLQDAYRRQAAKHVANRDYESATELLTRAKARVQDPELMELQQLVNSAAQAAPVSGVPDVQLVKQLDDLYQASKQPNPGLVRAALVAHHRRAHSLTQASKHREARDHWKRAHGIWHDRMAGKPEFWKGYLNDYNAEKQHRVQMSESDLESAMKKRMAAVCITLTGQALIAQIYDDAGFYWSEATRVASVSDCRLLFKEIVNLDAIVAQLNIKTNAQSVLKLYQFVVSNIDDSDTYKRELGNLQIIEAIEAMKAGNLEVARRYARTADKAKKTALLNVAVDHAIQELKAARFTACHSMLTFAGELDSDWVRLAARVKSLNNETLRAIVDGFREHPLAIAMNATNPQMADTALFQVVLGFAEIGQQVAGGLNAAMVRLTIDKVVMAVLTNMLKG